MADVSTTGPLRQWLILGSFANAAEGLSEILRNGCPGEANFSPAPGLRQHGCVWKPILVPAGVVDFLSPQVAFKHSSFCYAYAFTYVYSPDAGAWSSHNLIEIPDMDALRRGYMAHAMFTPMIDYTRCELPIVLKLSYGRMRSFEEVDGPPEKPAFFYIGDENPIGPKAWKNRRLLFVKPDYVVLLDRVFGAVPHRYNLHVTANEITRDGSVIRAAGRFDLDLLCYVQHPATFEFQTAEFIPAPQRYGEGTGNPHRQHYFRIRNLGDGIYRTLLFAQERGRSVHVEAAGPYGFKIVTPEYVDYVFANDDMVYENVGDSTFAGRIGWIRRTSTGSVIACLPDGDSISGFGVRIDGRGPWQYNMDGSGTVQLEGVPREIRVSRGDGK